jgi:16S rRNA (uracil1498-N3)-methyltransferase
MHLFFCTDLHNDALELPEEEGRHATGVLRLRTGDRIGLLDGKGTRAEAEITEAGRKTCMVRILSRTMAPPERRAQIHLAVAPTKQMERFEWMLEKCTEIGVDRVTPLITHRSERTGVRHDRLEKILVSAMKQSQRAWLPALDGPTDLSEVMQITSAQRFFGWCEGAHDGLAARYDGTRDALMLIGPEGDFTPEEAASLIVGGFAPVSLGTARLRTETAAVAAITWMNLSPHSR